MGSCPWQSPELQDHIRAYSRRQATVGKLTLKSSDHTIVESFMAQESHKIIYCTNDICKMSTILTYKRILILESIVYYMAKFHTHKILYLYSIWLFLWLLICNIDPVIRILSIAEGLKFSTECSDLT